MKSTCTGYRAIILFAFFFLFGLQTNQAQDLTSQQIDSLVNKAMSTMPHVGLAIAVIKDGKVIHSKGYGMSSKASGKPVDENTLFGIASNSKSFTAAALAMLVDEGKLNWNDKVVDHLPEFKMYEPYVTENFNILDLLTHRSGLDLGAGDLMFFPDGADFKAIDVMKSFQYQKPVSAFRTKYDYDNLLYIVAGELIARVSGMSWPDFIEKRIMSPIGMSSSSAIFQNIIDHSNVANPHSIEKESIKEFSNVGGLAPSAGAAGGIHSSVKDMSHWLLLQLNKGKYGDGLSEQLFSEKNQKMMWKPHTNIGFNPTPEGPVKTHFEAYGLGWVIKDMNGLVVFQHTGGLPGMLSSTVVIPEINAAAVVLTNADPGGYSFWTMRASITDLLIGAKPTDWISFMEDRITQRESKGDSVLTAVWKKATKADPLEKDPQGIIGIYKDNWFGKMEVFNKDGKLWMKSHRSPKLHGEMYYYQANTYAIKWEYQDMNCDAFAMFQLDEHGRGTGIKMKGISPNIDFSFDFQHLDLKRVSP